MIRLALNMLFADRMKVGLLVGALALSSLLMIHQAGVLSGIMRWTYAVTLNVRAPIWVSDPKVKEVGSPRPLRATDVYRVRSVAGVAAAHPLHSSPQWARATNGEFVPVQLIGVPEEAPELVPFRVTVGRTDGLHGADAVAADQGAIAQLAGEGNRLELGDAFALSDRSARVVAFTRGAPSFGGAAFVYAPYSRIAEYVPGQRALTSFVLVVPAAGEDPTALAARISRETGLLARTEAQLREATFRWYWKNTGIPVSFGAAVLLGFIVGAVVAGQVFYAFVLEHLRHFAAFKAMGASSSVLVGMVCAQAGAGAFIGYGLGAGLATALGSLTGADGVPPFVLNAWIPAAAALAIFGITFGSAAHAIRRVLRVPAAEVFKS